jgi:acetyl esterase/lipase
MIRSLSAIAALAACLTTLAAPAAAQADAAAAPATEASTAIALGTGPVPGPLGPEIWSGKRGERSVRNVVDATLTPVLPDPAKATGVAMIVAPGGAFMTLAWDYEGMHVARVLADHGIAAFVLKYRLYPAPRDWPGFGKAMAAMMKDWVEEPGKALRVVTPPYAVEDGIAALKLVRADAARWHIDPRRVGMIGFSAGARTTLRVTLDAAPADRPAFSAMIYPPMEEVKVPTDAPPAFVAMATDDALFGRAGYGLIESWVNAGRPIEFHAFQRGGHGFGLGHPNDTTAGWTDDLFRWLNLNGFGKKIS